MKRIVIIGEKSRISKFILIVLIVEYFLFKGKNVNIIELDAIID